MNTSIIPALIIITLLLLFSAQAITFNDFDLNKTIKKTKEEKSMPAKEDQIRNILQKALNTTKKETALKKKDAQQQHTPSDTATAEQALEEPTSGPPEILTTSITGDTLIGKTFTIHVHARDPDDILQMIRIKKAPYASATAWKTQSCTTTICDVAMSFTEQQSGSFPYIIEAVNTYGETDTRTIPITITPSSLSQTYLFLPAAIDGARYDNEHTTVSLSPTAINLTDGITTLTATGDPYASFRVNANTLVKVTYTKKGYAPDDDYYYFDSRLPQCSGMGCSFTDGIKTTICRFQHSPSYLCTYTNTEKEYAADFTYTATDPTLGKNVIRVLNPLYPQKAPVLNFQNMTLTLTPEKPTAAFSLASFVLDTDTPLPNLLWRADADHRFQILIKNLTATITLTDPSFTGSTFIRFYVQDPEGNTNTDVLHIVVPQTANHAPVLTTTTPDSNFIRMLFTAQLPLTGYATDADADSLTYTWLVDGNPVTADSLRYTFTPLSFLHDQQRDQNFTITFQVSDGKETTSKEWRIAALQRLEEIPPAVSDLRMQPALQARAQPIRINVHADDASGMKKVEARITYPDRTEKDYPLATTGNGLYTLLFQDTEQRGTYLVRILASDIYLNTNDAIQGIFTIDHEPPVVHTLTITPTPQARTQPVTLHASITDNLALATQTILVTYPDHTQKTFPLQPSGQDTYTLLFQDTEQTGNYTFRVTATDTSGNSNNQTVTSVLIRDTTKPVITHIHITPATDNYNTSLTITAVITDDVAVQTVFAEITSPDGSKISIPLTLTQGTTYTFIYPATTTLGSYLLTINATDPSNNIQTIIQHFNISDTIPPTIQDIVITPQPQWWSLPITLHAQISDDHHLSGAKLMITAPNNATSWVHLDPDGIDHYAAHFADTFLYGTYTYTITAIDHADNTVTANGAFIIQEDTIPPTITNVTITPATQPRLTAPVLLNASVTDNVAVASVHAALFTPNGTIIDIPLLRQEDLYTSTIPADALNQVGIYTLTLFARDTYNNEQQINKTFTLTDIVPPTISTFTITPNPQWDTLPVRITTEIADDIALTSIQKTIRIPNGTTYSYLSLMKTEDHVRGEAGTFNFYHTETAGIYTVTILASDTSGNTYNQTKEFIIQHDRIPPVITLSSPANGSIVLPTFFLNFSVQDNREVARCSYTIDNQPPLTLSSCTPFNLTIPTFGSHTITLFAEDQDQNSARATLSITIKDLENPVITSLLVTPQTSIQGSSVTIQTTATDNDQVNTVQAHITYPDTTQKTFLLQPQGSDSYALLFPETQQTGQYTLVLTVTDRAGNTQTRTTVFSMQPDTTAPTITILTPQSGQTMRQRETPINFIARDNSIVQSCGYTLDGRTEQQIVDCANFSLALASGAHTLTLFARDAYNNLGQASVSFSVDIRGTAVGVIRDRNTLQPLDNAFVELVSRTTNQVVASATTSSDGRYSFTVDADNYNIRASRINYVTKTLPGLIIDIGTTTGQDVYLVPS